ncbi:hypothetical protein COP1_004860 [Malus domestica]
MVINGGGILLLRRFQSGKNANRGTFLRSSGTTASEASFGSPPSSEAVEVFTILDGLKSSFDSRLVIEEMTSKQDMESNREVEVVQWTTKMKTQVPLSSSGEALICNVGLQSVSYGVCGTCRTTRCGVRLQREEIIPGDSSPFTSSFYNVHKLTLTGQSTSTSCSWDAGFRERQGVSLESKRGKRARKCGLAEGNDCMW